MNNYRYISPSEISSLDCWRSYRWKREGIKPLYKPKALNIGIAWDTCMGVWFQPVGMGVDKRSISQRLEDAIDALVSYAKESIKEADKNFIERYGEPSQEVADEAEEMLTLVTGMIEHFATVFNEDEHGICRASQFKIDAPLPSQNSGISNKFRLHGYIDRIMEVEGKLVIVDDKTTSRINESFFDDFINDLQMPLYAYGMQNMGHNISEVRVLAAAKILPTTPVLSKTMQPVLDNDGNPIVEPLLDDNGNKQYYKSGKNAGQLKTKQVKKHRLRSLIGSDGRLRTTTTASELIAAINRYGLKASDYLEELELLLEQGVEPFFKQESIHVNESMMNEAADILTKIAPFLDSLPDVPMRNKFRCSRCVFQDACIIADDDIRNEVIKTIYSTREEREATRDLEAATTSNEKRTQ